MVVVGRWLWWGGGCGGEVVVRVLQERLQELASMSRGFRKERSCTDMTAPLYQLIDKLW